ncbi:glutamine amidotransferase-related protein [Micromonospora sp. LOL_024]|uniref:glutamine amidotransferase-related protein n=1 Tax=Micromonospora sp. LOL_024 TaxID=3345412 RepID=UPI003A8545AA
MLKVQRVLLVDNYDSYTYNLYQLIGLVTGAPPIVVRNNAIPSARALRAGFTHVVVSPGPGHPADPRYIGQCSRLLTEPVLPVLGVCLGHQALAVAFGGTVRSVPPRHGHVSRVRHDGRGVLRGLPQQFAAVRYHSLAVVSVPDELEVAAVAEDGTVMALRHCRLPLHGVQFHPESISTVHGERLLRNFLDVDTAVTPNHVRARVSAEPTATLLYREVPWREPEDVFVRHYADRPVACWLDSARSADDAARMSYIGAPEGPRAHTVTYRIGDGLVCQRPDGQQTREPDDIFGFLHRQQREPRVRGDAPFAFQGGYIGYLGYELKALCGAPQVHEAEPPTPPSPTSTGSWCSTTSRAAHMPRHSPGRAGRPARRGGWTGWPACSPRRRWHPHRPAAARCRASAARWASRRTPRRSRRYSGRCAGASPTR